MTTLTSRVLPATARTVGASAPQRAPGSTKITMPAPRQTQVLQSGRAPAQLSLMLRPGAR
jgi:hypothetical protein